MNRIEELDPQARTGKCEEPVRHLHCRPSKSEWCTRAPQFDVEGKKVCRWHAAAIAFDILSEEPRVIA